MIAAPHPQYIFHRKNDHRYHIEYVEEMKIFFMNGLHGFPHYSRYIQNNEDDDKAIEDFIPFGIP
jgi:hypothetical protein